MAYPYTETGYNMFDMFSMMQKAIRRGIYNDAGFAACQLKTTYRTAMWNRIIVVSAEDCYGIVTKEIVALRNEDKKRPDDNNIGRAIALLCRGWKSRDACYFSCNFVLSSRNPREINVSREEIEDLLQNTTNQNERIYDMSGFAQLSMFGNDENDETSEFEVARIGAEMQKAIKHRDMDSAGYRINLLRKDHRDELWSYLNDYADGTVAEHEIAALKSADEIVNRNKSEKDEIFIAKACMILMYMQDERFEEKTANEIIDCHENIDWSEYDIKPIGECSLKNNKIPEWVYDCHTLKGKKLGKTDWDMTVTEQKALYPLLRGYFDEASWIYTYEDDYKNGVEDEISMRPIREYAKTHEANPVEYLPY